MPSKGFRQRGLLIPFLFLISSEGLSSLMRLSMRDGLLRGVHVSRNDTRISHLLFVDDSILFGEAKIEGVHVLKRILKEYELHSR